jgi:nucleoid-associated protein YgaU
VAGVATSRPPAMRKPITFVVKRGDNLSVIAAWFHQHGYGALCEWNRAVIGDNPNVIYPGQRITISGRSMTVGD